MGQGVEGRERKGRRTEGSGEGEKPMRKEEDHPIKTMVHFPQVECKAKAKKNLRLYSLKERKSTQESLD